MNQVHYFSIAELSIKLIFKEGGLNSMSLLPSFEPFRVDEPQGELFFELTIDDDVRPIPKEKRERIRTFDTGNGDTIVDRADDDSYQFIVKDLKGAGCSLLVTDPTFTHCRCALNGSYDMRCFGLNNALMLIFAFAGSQRELVLMHASLVRKDGKGYAFIAKSGTGKSTQVSLWLRHIPGCDLMNDDNPIVRLIDETPYIYGSPWSGKTPCYRNVKAKLGAITRIDRAPANSIERLTSIAAFASVLPSCSAMKWESCIYDGIVNTITRIVEATPVYTLHCLPDKEAALLCHNTISK